MGAATVSGTTYFKEDFSNGMANWVQSDWKKSSSEAGEFGISAGDWYGDAEADKGLKTTPDARFYAISKKVHAIFNYDGKNLDHSKNVMCETDQLTHLYTFIINNADNTYEVQVDGVKKESGSTLEDWPILKPKQINDPKVSKPTDWVDTTEIADPEDKKPDGWDDVPAQISDPDATKPEDWDDEDDGDWEAPMIDNPEYKGEWKAKMIKNPEYKG